MLANELVNWDLKTEGKNIVIVDDDDLVRSSLNAVLRQAGFTVMQFSSGVELLKTLKNLKTHAVLCWMFKCPE